MNATINNSDNRNNTDNLQIQSLIEQYKLLGDRIRACDDEMAGIRDQHNKIGKQLQQIIYNP